MATAIAKAPRARTAPKVRQTQLLIDGKWCDARSGKTFATCNPATEEKIADVAEGDAAEVRECRDLNGGVDKLRLSFYKEGDIGNDGVWDIWKLEGPAFSWFFRGSPHVHTWLNVARKA